MVSWFVFCFHSDNTGSVHFFCYNAARAKKMMTTMMLLVATFELLMSVVALVPVPLHGSAVLNRAPPTCRLGARADIRGGLPLEHAAQLVDLNNTAPCSGTLTSWHYCHYPVTGTASFQVWRRRGDHQLDLVRSQEFSIAGSDGQTDYLHLTCRTYKLAKADYIGVSSHDVLGVYVRHIQDGAKAVHVSTSNQGSPPPLYQLPALSEPSSIEISTLSVLARAVLHLSADIQPDIDYPAPSIHLLQRSAHPATGGDASDRDRGEDGSPRRNGDLSRYLPSHTLAAFLVPLVVLPLATVGFLCCTWRTRQHGQARNSREKLMPSKPKHSDDWSQPEVQPVPPPSVSNNRPPNINLSKDALREGDSGDPLVYEVPASTDERASSSPQVYELPVSAGENAQSPLLCEAPVHTSEGDPLLYEIPESVEQKSSKSNEKDLSSPASYAPAVDHKDSHLLLHSIPSLDSNGLNSTALNRISCSQEASYEPAPSEMELICQLAREEVALILAPEIHLISEIGRGYFGSIYKAQWRVSQKKPVDVMTIGLGTPENRIALLQAAVTMGRFKHPNVVTVVGVVTDVEHTCIVIEYFSKGTLLNYLFALRQRGGVRSVDGTQQLVTFAQQIARGMVYLSEKGVVHFGLAAKNIFVSANDTCKIGGIENVRLARYDSLYDESLVNWMSIEVLRSRHYSTFSDVWSFGCLLHEMWTLGEKPFKGCSPSEVVGLLSAGHRIPPPPGCSRKIYKLMITAW